ncbi:MAG: glycosyltransferase family 2 protein [Longimicrobiaceae bacterium]
MIYICIPALDEARTVGILLWKIRRVMEEFGRDYELLVLDDASGDDTAEVLAPYTRVLPLTVLRGRKRAGDHAALDRLIREANRRSGHPRRDVVVILQADFTEDPEGIPALVKIIEGGADVVVGVPRVRGEVPPGWRWTRRGLGWLAPRRLGAGVGERFSGFRAYRVSALRGALAERERAPLVSRPGWAGNVELLQAVLPHARQVAEAEVPVRYDRRQRPTRFRAWDTARELYALSRSRARSPGPAASPGS